MKTRLSVLCVALVTVLLLSAFSCSAGAKSSSKIFGDIDGDGLVTASDALKILRISVGLDNPNDEIKMLSDIDGDGEITAADALAVLRLSVGIETEESEETPINNDDSSGTQNDTDSEKETPIDTDEIKGEISEEEGHNMKITANGKAFSVTLEDNETVNALKDMLPMTLDMNELNGNEKYCYIDAALPSSPENIGHISEGDVMLYGDSCIVIFYKGFDTSYSYTKIGHIDDASGLAETLGKGNVTVTFDTNNNASAVGRSIQF